MNIQFRIRGLNANASLRRWLEQQLERLQNLIPVSSAEVVLEHQRDAAPACGAHVHLAVPGPDIHAMARDHTVQAAWLKVFKNLEGQIERRKTKQVTRAKTNRQQLAPPQPVVRRINRRPRLKPMPARSDNKPSILLMARGRTPGQSLRRVLEQGGYAVLPARDCREAVAPFLANSIDLVLLDLRVAVLHSLATFKLVHGYNPRLPFVVTLTPPVDLTAFDCNSCHTIWERPFHAATWLGVLRDILPQPAQSQTRRVRPQTCRHTTARHRAKPQLLHETNPHRPRQFWLRRCRHRRTLARRAAPGPGCQRAGGVGVLTALATVLTDIADTTQ